MYTFTMLCILQVYYCKYTFASIHAEAGQVVREWCLLPGVAIATTLEATPVTLFLWLFAALWDTANMSRHAITMNNYVVSAPAVGGSVQFAIL